MNKLTILTPTFNRAHTLKNLYQSLERQSKQDFVWIIIDDGSLDETKILCEKFIKHANFDIKYIYKKNGGKHTAINEGLKYIDTEYIFIVDSDDVLADDAVETIIFYWKKYGKDESISSIWFLQNYKNGGIVGTKFDDDEIVSTYVEIIINSNIKGDKKASYRTDLRKMEPFPVFKNEKFLGEGIIHKRVNKDKLSVFINKSIYICDYLNDGLTKAGLKMRLNNPLGGMINSKEFMKNDIKISIRIKKTILFIVYGLVASKTISEIKKECECKYSLILLLPIAIVYFAFWKKRYL